ncbi:response regulator [Permianibacter sp. IMCC34836]|uniref:response regulator n=1 Tax=Permianibacter fluminis TaxID=2738515 RepID=UPI001554E3B3|nr:response regulator [Permianibacter fluminis]NQD36029.1 response regulator [Permianibacter fluminis]
MAKRILLVEDDPIHQLLLSDMVTSLFPDALLQIVPDGFNALTMAPEFQPDAIITDVMMPQTDGLSFLHALLPLLTSNPHVLVLTSYSRVRLQRFGSLPDQAQFLQKPVSFEALKQATADWFAA